MVQTKDLVQTKELLQTNIVLICILVFELLCFRMLRLKGYANH